VSVTKNEEKILPFFLDYYQNCIGVNKIILYDGNSTDNTIKIAQENPLVELVIQDHEKCDERDLMWVRNESWKKIRNEYDWIIVCDVDEFLYHPEFRKKLEEYTSKGVTIPLVEGFDMISDEFPKFKKGSFLPDLIKTGTKDSVFLNKNIIFNSKEIDINYQFGCHSCQPIGNIVWSDKWDFKLLHYKWLSYEYVVKKTSYQYNRLSDYSLINNFGVHNKQFSETTYSDFQNRFLNSGNVITGKKHRMRYLDIDGWFDFENIYENVIKNKGDNLKILELGAWLGKSTSFMAEIIKESEKIVDFYVVDHWKGDPNIGDLHGRFPELQGDNVYPIFEKNVGDLINYMKVITAESEDASKKFPDKYFDFIFLDATKIYEDVLRDISIWYPKIKDDGVFGGHDYFSWGGVKKAVDQFARDNQLIVKTNKSSWLLEKEKGLKIFWHCYLINEWPEIFEEQMILIKESGLYDKLKTESIRLHYYGDREQSNKLFNLVNKHDRDGKIILNYIQNNNYEYPTIQELHKFSLENHSYVLYLHLKGVWSTADASKNKEAIISWRKCLEYFNIEKWSDCVQKLNEGYDVVGALYNYDEKEPLFRGNIWWSTTEHIKKLKYPEYDASKNPYPEDDGTWCRVECEKWINTIPNKFYNFYTAKDYGFYYVPIEEKDYRKELTELMGKYRMFFIQDDCGGVNRLFGLKDLIDENVNKNDVICEVGSFEGVSSELFSIYCKELYCVDYWDIKEDVNIPIAEERFNNMIKKHKNIKKIKKSSEEAVKDFENEYFDLVYIDASHEYEDVKKDILNWSPKIKNGGILSGHDYNMDFVKKAVNEFFPKSSIKIYRDSSWCVKIGMDKNKKLNDLLRKPRMFFNDNPDGNINTLYGLKDLIEENINEDSIVCEIGSFAGVSSELFSLYCKEIHCVDNWDSNDEIWWMKEYIEKAEKFFDDVMNRSSNIRKIKKTSENASMDYPNEYFDLVYIDGAHDYENVKKDILNWLPKVKESGVISGHDYYAFQNNEDTDVKKVIDELFEYVEVKIYGDSSWVIKKSDTLKKIALVCIAKDEDHYIDEWIKYNKKLGFDRIFIYENDWKSGINLPYVTKIDWPGECVQLSAYNDFIDKYKKEYDYVAFFDCDEFLVLKKHKNVHDFVKEYGGKNIAINWQLYGSDGKFERDGSRSLLKSFTKRQFDVDRHVKTIMYLKKDSRMMIVHHPDTQVFDTNGKSFIESYNKNGPTDVAVINHYRDKTLEDYRLRVKRGYADAKREDDIENWFLRKDSDNDVDDFAACDFMYKPKISVIIPTYERLNSLTECIESVVKQNYDNLEILVCHDGPSENFEKYRFDDDRIKFFQTEKKENKYGTEARNLLLKKAEGDYVIFLDDDNLLYDDYLNKMTSLIDDRTGMVVCRIHFNDKNWTNLILPRKNEILPCEIDSLNVLIESSVAKSVKWDNIDIGHDHRYITACEKSIKEKGMDVKYVSDILAVHRYLGEKSERPIVVFSHNYLFGNWIGIVKEQFSLLISSGLYDKCKHVYMSVTTESKTYIADERSVFTELIKSFDVNNKVTITINNENNFEYDCLQFMSEYSEGNPSDICYYHT
jgi:glycosyltransferase involved in cell wall biosynthesis